MTRAAAVTAHDASERYQLLAQIGSGGMGVVYEANDAQARRPVALKFPRREGNQKTARQQLAREAAAMSLPHDRHICSVYDLATCAGKACMVMERLVGQTLQSRIAAGPLATLELLDIALQLVEALGAIHRVGLVHQDVKPANVFLTTAGPVKVLDFGLAVVAGSSLAGGSIRGTPNYVAPERLWRRPADPRSDLFSLGVVIYEMATGRPPFAAPTCQDVLFNVMSVDPVPLRTLAPKRPPTLERLVRKLLKRNADDRYHSAAEVKKALRRIRLGCGQLASACPNYRRAWLPGPTGESGRTGRASRARTTPIVVPFDARRAQVRSRNDEQRFFLSSSSSWPRSYEDTHSSVFSYQESDDAPRTSAAKIVDGEWDVV